MAARSTLKASDADRERIAERLRNATAEGRLLAEELEERLTTAFRARTYGELDAVVADLPGDSVARRRGSTPGWVLPAIGLAVAVPIAIAVIAAVVFIVTGMLAMWGLWLFVAWFVLRSRGGKYHHSPHRRYPPPRGPQRRVGYYQHTRPAQPRSGFWL